MNCTSSEEDLVRALAVISAFFNSNYLDHQMIKVAIIAGGPSAERGVSLKSAQTIARHLPAEKYNSVTIDITPDGWTDMSTGQPWT